MTYVSPNFKTTKAFKDAFKRGDHIHVMEPGVGKVPENGTVYLEGPHFPEPHKWYIVGTMKDGKLVALK